MFRRENLVLAILFSRLEVRVNGYERYTSFSQLDAAMAAQIRLSHVVELVKSPSQLPIEAILLGPSQDIMAISNNKFKTDAIAFHDVRFTHVDSLLLRF